MNKLKNELIDSANGNQLGNGPEARIFFELRGFSNRRPFQTNIGGCALWHALERAVTESGNQKLATQVEAANKF